MPDPATPDDFAPDDFSDLTEQPYEWEDVLADFPPENAVETAPRLEPREAAPERSEADDMEIAAVVARPRYRLPTLVFGLLLVGIGLIFVWPLLSDGYILVPAAIIAFGAAGLALSLFAHWLSSGRTARGAFFLAAVGVLWGALTGAIVLAPDSMGAVENWPLFSIALGVAIFLTFVAEKRHDRRLIAPGLIVTTAGIVAMLVTRSILPQVVTTFARDSWPILAIVLIVGLLPLAFRRTSRKGA